jgi:hypothetical protein
MVAPRLMPRAEWERRLRQEYGCEPDAEEEQPLETGEWWKNAHGYLFPVPCDSAGNLRTDDWQQVLILIARLRPMDLDR